MEWSRLLQYRADILLWTLATTMSPLVSMALWYTVAISAGNEKMAHTTAVYYIFVLFVSTATLAWAGYFIAQEILNGEIAKSLMKPFSLFWGHIVGNIVEKTLRFLVPVPILIVALIFFKDFFKGSVLSPSLLPLALVSIILATCIGSLIDISLGLLAFWLEDAMQIRRFQDLLYQIGSGILIPYSFFPSSIHTALSFLPYRYIVSAPAEMLSNQMTTLEIFRVLGIQAIWVLLLFIIVRFEWKRGLARYAPPG